MQFCKICGTKLADGAKFCQKCGSNLKVDNFSGNQRQPMSGGKIYKCPYCGEILSAFEINCPACGNELRDAATTSAIREFSYRLSNAVSEYQKVNIIRSYPIPNTKEDIFEFMILASTNINEQPINDVFEAWIIKFEQCYQKAKLSFRQESDFVKIQAIYEKTRKDIKKNRMKGPLQKVLKIALPIAVFIVLNITFWSWVASEGTSEQEEVARLEAIVVEVEKALTDHEFDLAMMHAKSMDYSAWTANDELERQWDIKRDYLIKKIIAAAAKEGISLEYPTDTADESDQKEETTSYDYSQSMKEAEDNIAEFNKQMEEIKDIWNQYTDSEDVE